MVQSSSDICSRIHASSSLKGTRQSYKAPRASHVRPRARRPSFIQINPIFIENLPFPHQYQFPSDCCRNKRMTLRRRQVICSAVLEELLKGSYSGPGVLFFRDFLVIFLIKATWPCTLNALYKGWTVSKGREWFNLLCYNVKRNRQFTFLLF